MYPYFNIHEKTKYEGLVEFLVSCFVSLFLGMKMAAAVDEFGIWLIDKLKSLNTDESVFGSYITAILDGDDTLEEKKEALEAIISDFVVSLTFNSQCGFKSRKIPMKILIELFKDDIVFPVSYPIYLIFRLSE